MPTPGSTGRGRKCPICGTLTDSALCPSDRMATLLVDAPPSDPTRIRVGSLIAGRYEVERIIGRGGFGSVFAARHNGTGQGVALKVLASNPDDEEEVAHRRFFIEARVTSGLRHPNTIRVFDFGQDDDGVVFIAMELLNGHTLKQELRTRRREGKVFSEAEAVDIGIAVTRSLGEAHVAGLVHRDLKPDNVFLHQVPGDDPVVKVLDFGIVKMRNSGLTRADLSGGPGTPAYMSPEQALNRRDLDGRSDLYALGVILYQLVVGRVPFRGETEVQTLYMQAHDPPPSLLEQAKVPVSEAYVDVVTRCLEKDPNRRFESAEALRAALRECKEVSREGIYRSFHSNPKVVPLEEEQETLESTPQIMDKGRATPPPFPTKSAALVEPPVAPRPLSIGLLAALGVGLFLVAATVGALFLRTPPAAVLEPVPVDAPPPPPPLPAPTAEPPPELVAPPAEPAPVLIEPPTLRPAPEPERPERKRKAKKPSPEPVEPSNESVLDVKI